MSDYMEVETQYAVREALLKALRVIFQAEPEVGDGLTLYGFQGDARKQTADIVIRRQFVGGASNDIGFRWDSQAKTYTAVVSEYDLRNQRSVKAMAHLKVEYGRQYVYHEAERHGLTVEEIPDEGGLIRLRLRPKRQAQAGRRRLRVRRT